MTDWRRDPVILQVDADAREEFNSEWALRLQKAVSRPEHLELLRDLWLVAYSSGFEKGLDMAVRLVGLSDFPPTPPNGDRPDPDRDDLNGGEDDGDGPS